MTEGIRIAAPLQGAIGWNGPVPRALALGWYVAAPLGQETGRERSMKIWIDAQLSPNIAGWIRSHFAIEAVPVRELGLRDAKDIEIFRSAGHEGVVVLSKDADFPHLLSQHGPPPKVLWLTCGNTSNAKL